MDFRLEGLLGSGPSSALDSPTDPPKAESTVFGSGPFKQGRPHSSVSGGDEEWRSLKLVRTADDLSVHKEMQKDAARSNSTDSIASLFSDAQHRQQMLSFSSLTSSSSSTSSHILETVTNSRAASLALPYLSYAPFSCNSLAGFGSGNLYGGSVPVVLMGTRGPFTPSQWIELEHQALIYKYITANIPVPSNLLIPIKKALHTTSFSCIPGRYLGSNSLGWGSFHLGFSNTGDPELGRCRRTDGKKWRCSKDAVADQKYCEKHMNRGRHRSRKPVEGQNGHPVTGTTTAASKMPVVTPASAAETLAAVVPGCGASDSLATMAHHQQMMKSLHPCVLSDDDSLKRFCVHRGNANDQKQNLNDLFPMMKQQSTYQDMSRKQFTLDNSYSLFDSPHKNSSLLDCQGFDSSQDLDGILELDTPRGSARQFINNQPDNSVNRDTYLSILMPLVSSDMNSATSSPTNDKASLLPLRVSRKSDLLNMNLGVVATIYGEPIHKQNISWGSSQGGPLGEVLHQTSNIANNNAESKNSSLLTLMKEGWDYSPSMGSSPRGVLQKTTFHTHSNSSSGSSPCTENKSVDGINEHLSSSRANSSSLPDL